MPIEDLFAQVLRAGSELLALIGIFNAITLVVSLCSLVVSFRAMRVTRDTHSDEIASNLINQNFDDFIGLHTLRAEFPYHGHLFELQDQYQSVKSEVVLALAVIPDDQRQMLLPRLALEERALARRIFSQYENAFYQWQNTSRSRDKSRLWFHKDVADYFSTRLLRNPRLVWFWSESGGNYRLHYEPLTREHYKKNVVVGPIDSEGPFHDKSVVPNHELQAAA